MRCKIADADDYEEAGEHCRSGRARAEEYEICCRCAYDRGYGIDVFNKDIRHLERADVTKDAAADAGHDAEEDDQEIFTGASNPGTSLL